MDNWKEIQLRFKYYWSEEDCKTLKDYFTKAGSELWPFNQMGDDDDGFGNAFFGTTEEFDNYINMLDEDGKNTIMEEIFEVGFMDRA